jgi:inner membrane transporter RhtA
MFAHTSPTMTAWLRNTVGALLLGALLLVRRGSLRGVRLVPAAALGIVMGTMNATFYESIARLPLGDAVAVEFTGPIVIAAVTASSRRHLTWVALAALGVAAITRPGPQHLNYLGLIFVGAAATCWALYILLGRIVATGGRRADSLVIAMATSSLFLLVPAALRSAATVSDMHVLALGAVIGALGSAVPYSVELMAMERVPPAVFGVLLSLQPIAAALLGYALLRQGVGLLEAAGFALVMTASIGVTLRAAPRRAALAEPVAAS